MADTFEEYLERGEQAGVIDFHLRIARTPEGKLDFYIHPQGKDGETGDFTVSAAFVSKLDCGAGSSRTTSPPLSGSSEPTLKASLSLLQDRPFADAKSSRIAKTVKTNK